MNNLPVEAISWEALLTTAGVAAVTTIITNLLRDRVGLTAKWLALVIAPILSVTATFAVAAAAGRMPTVSDVGLAVLVGLTAVYSMGFTGNELLASRRETVRTIGGSDGFFRSWL